MKYIWGLFTIGILACNGSQSSTQIKVEDSLIISSNKDCGENKTLFEFLDEISIDTLTNGSQIYWSYNCDSTWLTLENKDGKKNILYSLGQEMIELTTRIGHVHFTEFRNTILYVNKVISGCCDPVDYYLYNKEDASLINYLGRGIFASEDSTLPYFVYYKNSGYSDEDRIAEVNKIWVLNLNTLKSTAISVPDYVSDNIINIGIHQYPEQFTITSLANRSILTIEIPYALNPSDSALEKQYKIKLDLKKY